MKAPILHFFATGLKDFFLKALFLCAIKKIKTIKCTTNLKAMVLAAGLCLTGLSSCKKTYTCSCKTTLSATGYSASYDSKEQYSEKMKEKQAKAACDNSSSILESTIKAENAQTGLNTS